jgi:hypothetical protein
MNSATAGKPASQGGRNKKSQSQATHLFTTSGLVSLASLVPTLAAAGLTLNRVHQKQPVKNTTADSQLMLVYERGKPQITPAQADEIAERYLTVYSCAVTARQNRAVPATSEIHKGVPDHILYSCSGPTPKIAEPELRYTERMLEVLKGISQVRVSINLATDMIDNTPSWVEQR